MDLLDTWLVSRGNTIADLLDDHRELICAAVSERFVKLYGDLCYDETRPDALPFQLQAFRESPRRLHRALQLTLRTQLFSPLANEFRWVNGILPRYGVGGEHLHALIHWYFVSARAALNLTPGDRSGMAILETAVSQLLDVNNERQPMAQMV